MYRSVPALAAAVIAASVASFPACGMHGPYNAEARDTWSRTYTLSKTGEVSISERQRARRGGRRRRLDG